jgi:DNA-binding SARP family transcriptional activator
MLEFRVLGPLEVRSDGRPLPLGGPRQHALLALLLLRANQVVSSDTLLDELWPEEQPLAGRAALRVRVSQLRKALGADVVVTRSPGYLLAAAPEQIDLHRFEQLMAEGSRELAEGRAERAAALLREALALWRGDALAELAYESFAQPEIARLEELRLAAFERRVEADLALGRHAELVPELESAVARHPLRERLRAHLMLALYRSGRQADALEAYQDARRALVDGLGIEPSRALLELEAAILRQDQALEPPARAQAAAPAEAQRALLVVVRGASRLDGLCTLGAALASSPRRELILARLVGDADDLPSASGLLRERVASLAASVVARAVALTTEAAGEDVGRLAAEQDVDLLVIDVDADDPPHELAGLVGDVPCDVGLLLGGEGLTLAGDRVVAVPFGGAEHDWAAVEVGAWLARATGVPLALVGTLGDPASGRRDASRLLASASLIVQRVTGIVAEPRLAAAGARAIGAAVPDAALLVAGLSPRWRREGIGAERLALARAVPVLLVRKGLRPGGLAPPESLTRFTWTMSG